MKSTIKKILINAQILILVIFTASCNLLGDPDVKNVENLINEIGTVSLDSSSSIEEASIAYNKLTEKEKEKVDNYEILENAINEFKFLFAQSIYNDITTAVEICSENMEMYIDAWYYGIWEDEDTLSLKGLSDEVGISADELDTAIRQMNKENDIDFTMSDFDDYYIEEFSVGLWIVDRVFNLREVFPKAENLLTESKSKLKDLEKKYPDYEYNKDLVDYFNKANAFYQFSSDRNGSYETFKETVSDYEKALDEFKSNLEYTFSD